MKRTVHPTPGQIYGPGKEPQSVRDAYDAMQAQGRRTAPDVDAEAAAEAELD
jgi:hypothetical protein